MAIAVWRQIGVLAARPIAKLRKNGALFSTLFHAPTSRSVIWRRDIYRQFGRSRRDIKAEGELGPDINIFRLLRLGEKKRERESSRKAHRSRETPRRGCAKSIGIAPLKKSTRYHRPKWLFDAARVPVIERKLAIVSSASFLHDRKRAASGKKQASTLNSPAPAPKVKAYSCE